jgi:phosphatidylserine/phosphatidylglycerophosphate/cardiolipin synthase-like enzyme
VLAADRGVRITGAMPRDETGPDGNSQAVYEYLTNHVHYATSNRVEFLTAYSKADYSSVDDGETALIHAKYMVIDPFGTWPVVIHGSANWSSSALLYTDTNDENILFLRHADIARVFYANFKRITGAFMDRNDFWMDMATGSEGLEVTLWRTDTNAYSIESCEVLGDDWEDWQPGAGGRIGSTTFAVPPADRKGFYRATRAP